MSDDLSDFFPQDDERPLPEPVHQQPIEQITEGPAEKERVKAYCENAPEVGIWPGVDFSTYLGWQAVDCSLLKALAHTPSMAHLRMTTPEDDKPAYLLGRLFHMAATQPEQVEKEFALRPATYTATKMVGRGVAKHEESEEKPWNGNANECKRMYGVWKSEGIEMVKPDDWVLAHGMAESVRKHPKLGRLIDGGEMEVSAVWIDLTHGLPMKARWDIRKNRVLADLKSTTIASEYAWMNQAYRFKYHMQAGIYVDAQLALDPCLDQIDNWTWFIFAAVEKYPPYALTVWDVMDVPDAGSYQFLQLGRATYKMLLGRFRQCLGRDEWPGYEDEHRDMMLPRAAESELAIYGL